jgi:hypothetical protein
VGMASSCAACPLAYPIELVIWISARHGSIIALMTCLYQPRADDRRLPSVYTS